MNFHVRNLSTNELIAELHDRELAIGLAHQLAMDRGYRERFGVVELVTIYETWVQADERE